MQYSDTRRAFNAAIAATSSAPAAGHAHPLDRWAVAEAGLRLDAMKAKIAEITHPWQLVQGPEPDLGGQHLISLHAMRHEVAEGADRVHSLISQIDGTTAVSTR